MHSNTKLLLKPSTCDFGVGVSEITPDGKHPMAGYSWASKNGKPGSDKLYARALYLSTPEEKVVLCFVDLMSASKSLWVVACEQLRVRGLTTNLVLAGTHTHSAPGNFYGNTFYDLIAQRHFFAAKRGYQPALVQFMATRIADAVEQAVKSTRQGRFTILESLLWGKSRSRSLEPFDANFVLGGKRPFEDVEPPGLSPEEQAIDPRVTSFVALDDANTGAVFSLFGCHATALGPGQTTFARDWPGYAVTCAESLTTAGDLVAAVGLGNAGDITPLPLNGKGQGERLAKDVGQSVGGVMHQHYLDARDLPAASQALELGVTLGVFKAPEVTGEPQRWMIGWPALGGAEDGRSFFHLVGLIAEGRSPQPSSSTQSPKRAALPIIQFLTNRKVIDIHASHPWQCVQFGTHRLITVPGEPTVMAGKRLEAAHLEIPLNGLQPLTVTTLGYAGDYAGYFTTEEEYELQHYEGASNLYGKQSLDWLIQSYTASAPAQSTPRESMVRGLCPAIDAAPSPATSRPNTFSGKKFRQPQVPYYLRFHFILSAVVAALIAFSLLAFPAAVLSLLGWQTTGLTELLCRMKGLAYVLLTVELVYSFRSQDLRVALGFAGGLSLVSGVTAAVLWPLQPLIGFGFSLIALAWLIAAADLTRERLASAPPRQETSPFTLPLVADGLLTLVFGVILVAFPGWVLGLLGATAVGADMLIRLYGAYFLTNSVLMFSARFTRDCDVLGGQFWGSLALDGPTSVLLLSAASAHVVGPVGYVFSAVYAVISVTLWGYAKEAEGRRRYVIEKPTQQAELRDLVGRAQRLGLNVRVAGAGHSVNPAIYSNHFPFTRSERTSSRRGMDISLENYARYVSHDPEKRRITVQAGMHLGVAPNNPSSNWNNLGLYLQALGWALPDLGGITQQTVAGFFCTGSSGGSLRHSVSSAIWSLKVIRADAEVVEVNRDHPDFQALALSLGLFGIISEVTLQCEPAYQVHGDEIALEVWTREGEKVGFTIPREIGATSNTIDVEFSEPGALATFFRKHEYCRMLWWPQPQVNRIAVWRAERADPKMPHKPLQTDNLLKQWVASRFLALFGRMYGRTFLDWVLTTFLAKKILASVIRLFLPARKTFCDSWQEILPMDNRIDDQLLPTEFIELWVPIGRSHEVMSALAKHYRVHGVRASGTYACEIYTAKAAKAWLSPAHDEDMLRIDIFWFRGNPADPVESYFPQFWKLLAPFGFRSHWGKYLPPARGAEGVAYHRKAYPRWDDFLVARERWDPEGLFLNDYWKLHLGISEGRTKPGAKTRPVDQGSLTPSARSSESASANWS